MRSDLAGPLKQLKTFCFRLSARLAPETGVEITGIAISSFFPKDLSLKLRQRRSVGRSTISGEACSDECRHHD
jgi:hypothetical protein